MKKISCSVLLALMVTMPALAGSNSRGFVREVSRGLDIIGAESNAYVIPDAAPGELGNDVYQSVDVIDSSYTRMFIPTTMYVRAGGGLNLGFASDLAEYGDTKHMGEDGYVVQIGLGWNLSSYVRTEIDTQIMTLKFADLADYQADYKTLGAMLYFDLARRYVQSGDVTRIRHFVPFVGVGAAVGYYEFEGANGASGVMIAAPRAEIGFSIMLTDIIGIDVAYQYQMMIGNGFGWNVSHHDVDNISNVIASFRVNF